MKRIKMAVIGGGHLGRIHARLLGSIAEVELVGVADPVAEVRQQVARDCHTTPYASHRELIGQIDAAVVAVPTVHHYAVGQELLKCGIHLLIEKPLAPTRAEAHALVQQARAQNRVLQVGHVERFNPALAAAREHLAAPKYVDAVRASGFTFRSTDIGVVLDLMIHDLDVLLSLVDSEVRSVEALGFSVFGRHEDMVQARLTFANGCVANLAASRCSFQPQRTMHVFTTTGYVQLDFAARQAKAIRPDDILVNRQFDVDAVSATQKKHLQEHLFSTLLPVQDLPGTECNALLEELQDFVTSILTGRAPQVTGQQGCAAVDVAERILEKVAAHCWDETAAGPSGPPVAPEKTVLPGPQWPSEETWPTRRKAG